jgi:hypothetical protein
MFGLIGGRITNMITFKFTIVVGTAALKSVVQVEVVTQFVDHHKDSQRDQESGNRA